MILAKVNDNKLRKSQAKYKAFDRVRRSYGRLFDWGRSNSHGRSSELITRVCEVQWSRKLTFRKSSGTEKLE